MFENIKAGVFISPHSMQLFKNNQFGAVPDA